MPTLSRVMSLTHLQDTEDLGSDFNLAGAIRESRNELEVWFGRSDQGAASTAFRPPWPSVGLNPLGPTLRAETQHGAAC